MNANNTFTYYINQTSWKFSEHLMYVQFAFYVQGVWSNDKFTYLCELFSVSVATSLSKQYKHKELGFIEEKKKDRSFLQKV